MSPYRALERLGYALTEPLPPKGSYVPARIAGGLLWVSGHTGRDRSGARLTGTVGLDVTDDEAREEARRAAVNLLSAAEAVAGLDHVAGVVHLRGYVRAVPHYTRHPGIIDAASGLLTDVLGTGAAHARTAVGVASLPGGAAVELEAVLALHD